jgi:ABC-type phosphate transport system auxiliary subunit
MKNKKKIKKLKADLKALKKIFQSNKLILSDVNTPEERLEISFIAGIYSVDKIIIKDDLVENITTTKNI